MKTTLRKSIQKGRKVSTLHSGIFKNELQEKKEQEKGLTAVTKTVQKWNLESSLPGFPGHPCHFVPDQPDFNGMVILMRIMISMVQQ